MGIEQVSDVGFRHFFDDFFDFENRLWKSRSIVSLQSNTLIQTEVLKSTSLLCTDHLTLVKQLDSYNMCHIIWPTIHTGITWIKFQLLESHNVSNCNCCSIWVYCLDMILPVFRSNMMKYIWNVCVCIGVFDNEIEVNNNLLTNHPIKGQAPSTNLEPFRRTLLHDYIIFAINSIKLPSTVCSLLDRVTRLICVVQIEQHITSSFRFDIIKLIFWN